MESKITFRIDASKKEQLEKIALSKKRSLTNYMLMLVDFAIDNTLDDSNFIEQPTKKAYTQRQAEILKELGINL